MKILQIERVILHLPPIGIVELTAADLELQDDHPPRRRQYRIDPPPQPPHRIFQKQRPSRRLRPIRQRRPQQRDTHPPCPQLLRLVPPKPLHVIKRQPMQQRRVIAAEKIVNSQRRNSRFSSFGKIVQACFP